VSAGAERRGGVLCVALAYAVCPQGEKKSRSSTAATTPRPPARHALEDLFDQDSVVGSGIFDSDSDGIDS
jgi:hypothetical protein